MFKKIAFNLFLLAFAFGINGCVFVAAEISKAENVSKTIDVAYNQSGEAVKCAFRYMNINFEKASASASITAVRGKYEDGRSVMVEVTSAGPGKCQVAVRVGTSEAGKKDASDILRAIEQCVFALK